MGSILRRLLPFAVAYPAFRTTEGSSSRGSSNHLSSFLHFSKFIEIWTNNRKHHLLDQPAHAIGPPTTGRLVKALRDAEDGKNLKDGKKEGGGDAASEPKNSAIEETPKDVYQLPGVSAATTSEEESRAFISHANSLISHLITLSKGKEDLLAQVKARYILKRQRGWISRQDSTLVDWKKLLDEFGERCRMLQKSLEETQMCLQTVTRDNDRGSRKKLNESRKQDQELSEDIRKVVKSLP